MQLHQLRYLVTLAEEGQFVRAASRLHVAQPSVSSAVRALEAELGANLFDRSRQGAILTAAGEAFLPWARQVLTDCDAGVAAVDALAGLERGRVTLGATPSLTTTVLPPVLAAFRTAYPGVELVVDEAGSGDLVRRLERSLVDFALIVLPVSAASLQARPLGEEELVVAVPAGHPLSLRQALEVSDLRDVPLVMFRDGYDLREATLDACRHAGFQPSFAVEGLEMDGVLAMAGAGLGAAVLPASVVPPGGSLRAVRFARRELVRHIGVAQRRDRTTSRAMEALLERVEVGMRRPAGPAPPARASTVAPPRSRARGRQRRAV
ncbi:MAG: LysR family transcriptional regulator [Actinomycetota bacterium]|jgi:DNA-binding transcriptional LysR family regulator|nr:LysR family transcriptional regulator [Actinomycetota bacterium]